MDWTYFLPCVWAFFGCLGFCAILNIRAGLLICCFGGTLAWLVYLLLGLAGADDLLSCFVSAMAVSAYSEIMARVRKCPVTGYLLISSFPLVPGAGLYYTMEYAVQGDTERFLDQGLHTLGTACCLAVGILVMSSAIRLALTLKARKRG